jgi:thiol-disulfide isomerase/thioredoxin
MDPNPAWDAESYPAVVAAFEEVAEDGGATVHVWGADWCGDCRSQLPDLAAAFDAAGVEPSVYPVERGDDGKTGPKVDAYDVTLIPTVVVEGSDGEELARFEEQERLPPAQYLADELEN